MASPPPDDSNARAYPLEGMPGPRWDRKKAIYPSHLHTYLDCPNRCRLEYVDRVPVARLWDRKIEVGNALHKIMEETANMLRLRQPPRPIHAFRSQIESLLPAEQYEASTNLSLDDRTKDVENVLQWAGDARDYITDPRATMIRIEKYYPRDFNAGADLGPVKLGAKADLVMKRQDTVGAYIEIIDYKTGYWQRPTDFAPALSRISHKPQIRALLSQHQFPRVVFTYLWLAREEVVHIELNYDHMLNQWRELKRILTRMVHEERWPMRPSPKVCKHCPYFDIECFPYPQAVAFTALDSSAERG